MKTKNLCPYCKCPADMRCGNVVLVQHPISGKQQRWHKRCAEADNVSRELVTEMLRGVNKAIRRHL